MDIFVQLFGSDEPPRKIADVDEEETIPTLKEMVAAIYELPVEQVRLIDDGAWGSLLKDNGTVEDISNNLVHLVVMPADRTWDQFFFFVRPIGGKRVLVEADFLETVASVKSRLLLDQPNRPADSEIGLIYRWNQLADEMAFDDEQVDVEVGCTLDLFVREPNECQLIIKSTCYKSFTILADLDATVQQLMTRIESQEGLAVAHQILMNLSGAKNDVLLPEVPLAAQDIT